MLYIGILSITGVVKMVLMILGAMVVLRFIGQLMQAKRNLAAQQAHQREREALEKRKKFVAKHQGKVHLAPKQTPLVHGEDVDYEEVK